MTVEQYQVLVGKQYLNDDGEIRTICSVHIYVSKNTVSAQIYTYNYKFEPYKADRVVESWRETVV